MAYRTLGVFAVVHWFGILLFIDHGDLSGHLDAAGGHSGPLLVHRVVFPARLDVLLPILADSFHEVINREGSCLVGLLLGFGHLGCSLVWLVYAYGYTIGQLFLFPSGKLPSAHSLDFLRFC
jgi:hypothetical protein